MATWRSVNTPYGKRNVLWPLQFSGGRLKAGQLVDRYDAAVRHLIMTPKGSLLYDISYGTDFYKMRTQGMNEHLKDLAEADLSAGFQEYLPDCMLQSVEVVYYDDEEKMTVNAYWGLKGDIVNSPMAPGSSRIHTTEVTL